nr:Fic family protein [uncultured Dyadobacter sp.]
MMKILPSDLFTSYLAKLSRDLPQALGNLNQQGFQSGEFNFYTSVAVISSCRIEGETIELDSYLKHKMQHVEYLPELTQKPNDLFRAYVFAKENRLNKDKFLQAHCFISEHLLPQNHRGVYRRNEMVVMEHNTGRIQFEAAPAGILVAEMGKLWEDVDTLLRQDLSVEEVLFYASLLHLIFVSIHPFNDGNGRAGRLLEKWFLADKLGPVAWYIQSEKFYYQHVNEYYLNLNRLGLFYEELDFNKAERFLMMLPEALDS